MSTVICMQIKYTYHLFNALFFKTHAFWYTFRKKDVLLFISNAQIPHFSPGTLLTIFNSALLTFINRSFDPRFKFQSDDPQITVPESCLLLTLPVINQRKSRWTNSEEGSRISEVITGPEPSNLAGLPNLPSIPSNIHHNCLHRNERELPPSINNRWLFTAVVFEWIFLKNTQESRRLYPYYMTVGTRILGVFFGGILLLVN